MTKGPCGCDLPQQAGWTTRKRRESVPQGLVIKAKGQQRRVDDCNSDDARGQQEGLQYGGGSSGAVDSRIAQVENIGKMWDRLYEGAISGLVIIFHA